MRVITFITSFILCYHTTSYSQKKVVVIDTLISVVDDYILKNSLISTCDRSFQGILDNENLNVQINYKAYPNAVVGGITGDCIHVLLDDKRGYCSIEGIKNDTVHISKWAIYDCGLSDSTKGNVEYYHYVNGNLLEIPYKIKPVRRKQTTKGINYLEKISITVNGQLYHSKISVGADTLVKLFHGYTPRRKYRKYISDYKFRKTCSLTYFHGEVREIMYNFSSTLELNNPRVD